MKFRKSIKFRIVFTMLTTSVILACAYSTLLWFKMEKNEEQMLMKVVEFEGRRYLDCPHGDINALLPPFLHGEVYFGTNLMPDKYKDLVKGINEGTHKTKADTKYYVFARNLPENDDIFYLILRSIPDDRFRKVKFIALHAFGGIVFVVIVLVLLTTRVLSRMVTSPLVNLVSTLKNSHLDKLPDNFSKDFYDDEVGFLAKTIEDLLKRLKKYVAREHQFTKDVSHELRTPVAVIKSSVELVEEITKGDDGKLSPNLMRIKRSLIQMESTIEALLWLYKDDKLDSPKERCSLAPIADEITENYKIIHQDKRLKVDFIVRNDSVIMASPSLLRVIVDNLIRNAFQHTYDGEIKIEVNQDGLEVVNSGVVNNRMNNTVSLANDYQMNAGFGIGLDLVKRLCERFGWKLTINILDKAKIMAKVNFYAE